ncbi:MAG: histidinol-phosphate transaminase [Saprospiraceae bacterium]|nr:histidinol-phosphate transaminase [Saprospiraceae bacterium]
MDIQQLLRENIRRLKPYSSARDEFSGQADIYIDANENPYNAAYNRYPDPLQKVVKKKISQIKGVPFNNIFLGNGSDEPIDLIIRAFCNPGIDNVIAPNPSYGMYKVSADINDVQLIQVPLTPEFHLNFDDIRAAADAHTKVIFLCSPNNPSGNCIPIEDIKNFVSTFQGIVVVDEAYIDFCDQPSMKEYVNIYPNLVILQTLSKAWGAASVRMGMAFASAEIIQILNKIKPPYNISKPAQEAALEILEHEDQVRQQAATVISERKRMALELTRYKGVKEIFPSEANFLLVRVDDANKLYHWLTSQGIIVRNRHGQLHCDNCLRLTVGTPTENDILFIKLNEYYHEKDFVFG